MNRVGCDDGVFSDEILLFSSLSSSPSCNSPVAGFIVFLLVFLLLRTTATLIQCKTWIARYRSYLTDVAGGNRHGKRFGTYRRFPIIPGFSILALFFQLMFLILVAANVASSRNSISLALLGLFYLPCVVNHVILVRRYVRLGNKLLPKSMRNAPNLANTLTANDSILNVLLGGMVAAGITIFSASFFVAPIALPGRMEPLQIVCIAVGVYQVCAALSVIWQMQRCLIAIALASRGVDERMFADPERHKASVRHATTKMRQQQVICLLIAILGGVVNILIGVRVIDLRWWVVCLTQFGYENLFEIGSVLNMTRSFAKQKKTLSSDEKHTPQQTHLDNDGTLVTSGTFDFRRTHQKDQPLDLTIASKVEPEKPSETFGVTE